MIEGTVSSAHPARRATLGDQLRRNAARFPDREAIVVPAAGGVSRRSVTYAALDAGANRLASALAARGVAVGDVVALMGRNTPELIQAFWAAMKLGAAVTGVNYTFTAREMAYQLRHSGAKVVVAEDAFAERVDGLDDPLPDLALRIVDDRTGAGAPQGWVRLADLDAEGSPLEPASEVTEDTLAILPYTSGTEALPKAVMVPHRNYLTSMIPAYTTGIGLVEEDVWYYVLPLHTIAGMGMQIALLSLANTIVLPGALAPADALAVLGVEGVTVLGQTPTFYLQLIGAPAFADTDLSRLRRAITYGGTMPQAMFDAFAEAAPTLEWVTLWSQSELTQTPTIGRFRSPGDIPGGDATWIGRPTAELEVRVVDDDDRDVGPGVEGELLCRSPGVMAGYHRDPERTAAVLRGGWLHTGDLVRHDGAGNLFFVDRRKDVIKTGGMNVSSVEVERVCYQFPAVQEVAVVGLADDYWSQAVTAFVVPRTGSEVDPDALVAHCRAHLAAYKVPKAVRVVEALPKDTQGKILKRELRRRAEAGGPA